MQIISRINLLEKFFGEIRQIKYNVDAGSLSVRVGRRMVIFLVGGVGSCCGRPKCLRSCIGRKLNVIWLKLRIVGLIMERKSLFIFVKMKINANNVSLCALSVGVPCYLEEKSIKMS